jgi:hypothetical protein
VGKCIINADINTYKWRFWGENMGESAMNGELSIAMFDYRRVSGENTTFLAL